MVHAFTYVLLLLASAVLLVAAKSHLDFKHHRGEQPELRYRPNDDKPRAEFVIEDRKIGGILHSKVILNKLTGERAEIVVDYGGRIEDLVLVSQRDGKLWPVLLTHKDNATAIVENKWWMGMPLIPWANRIAYGKYTFFNDTHQLPLNEDTPELKNALHGLMDGVIMEVRSTDISDEHAQLVLGHQTNGTDTGYPFRFDLEINYTLSYLHIFSVSIRITNLMEHDPLPLYVGWHPYFVCTVHSTYVILDQCTGWNHVELNANKDPTGITVELRGFNGSDPIGGNSTNPTFYDDEYKPKVGFEPDCYQLQTRIVDNATNHTIHLTQAGFRLVHIFTGREGAVAVEPMSGMADAYNNHDHLTVLSGGEVWEGSFGINIDSFV